jgi:hypothetical protein
MIDAIQDVSPVDAQGFRCLRDRTKTDSETLKAKPKLQTRIDLVEEIQDWVLRFLADQPPLDNGNDGCRQQAENVAGRAASQ